ncbi:response regulator transcription factor (plasmid) [Polymorphobacter sp. PAMC 29334]|uniref:response regulator n=1 Tax=Polymorphobacter sp. PAMC 29334 TaxID=2862331 RepID=UPI001C666742|nr:response regulator transcription factor [Polymorphobacter sp. PAMC 29334]QYE33290.1 response regulator transcription factor [Polymorphobacter sp. PAMC 29334]
MTDAEGRIRIMVADDHPALRYGIAAMIEMQPDMVLVGEAANGREAVEGFRNLRPDIVLMDLQMPVMSGLDAISAIRAELRTARIVVLTTYAGDAQAARALKAGASAYLLKTAIRTEMIDIIRSVHAGRRHLPPDIAQEIALHAGDEPLSEREIGVLNLAASGNANKQIAWKLSISEETVKAHMRSIFAKLDVNDRTHAVTTALRRGIIKL